LVLKLTAKNIKMHKLLISLAIPLVFVLTSARLVPARLNHSDRPAPEREAGKPKNIIIVIVDGVGASEWSAAAAANGGSLQVGKFPYTGLMKIWHDDNMTPDDCANASALATGLKGTDGVLCLNDHGGKAKTLAEYARDRKMLTALVSVSSVTSTSAAAFFVHEDLGVNDEKIAAGISRFRPDILIGGGEKYFSNRADKKILLDSFRSRGYEMINKQRKAERFTSSKTFGLISDDALLPVTKRGNFLSEACLSAVRNMAPYFEGYFMIIHSGQVEQAVKSNTPAYMCEEIKDVNKALTALYQQAPNMDETLVVVLSPSETGGFVLNGGSLKNGSISGSWASQKATAAMVPVFASGPGAEKFAGMYDNTDVFSKILSLMR